MMTFLRRLFRGNPAWKNGQFVYLLGRENDPRLCEMDGVSPEQVERGLALFCEAFDLPMSQRHCLRPSDQIMDIYKAMVGDRPADDLELERLLLAVETEIGRPAVAADREAMQTIGGLIRFLHENAPAVPRRPTVNRLPAAP